eukprot:scaffold1390_cov172-Amphora_coffeaeformis.AAC.4
MISSAFSRERKKRNANNRNRWIGLLSCRVLWYNTTIFIYSCFWVGGKGANANLTHETRGLLFSQNTVEQREIALLPRKIRRAISLTVRLRLLKPPSKLRLVHLSIASDAVAIA